VRTQMLECITTGIT